MEGDGMLWGEGREAPPFHISAVLGSDVRCKVAGGKCQRRVRGGRWQESGGRGQVTGGSTGGIHRRTQAPERTEVYETT